MKLTKAQRTLLDGLRTKGHVFEWYDILTVPNGLKHLTSIANRNIETYRALATRGIIRPSTTEEVSAFHELHDSATSRLIHKLEDAVNIGDWLTVENISSDLAWRTGKGHPRNAKLFSIEQLPQTKTLAQVFAEEGGNDAIYDERGAA